MDTATAKDIVYCVVYLAAFIAFFLKIKNSTESNIAAIAELKKALFENGEARYVTKSHCAEFSQRQMERICRKLDALKDANEKTLDRVFYLIDQQTMLAAETRERVTTLESKRE